MRNSSLVSTSDFAILDHICRGISSSPIGWHHTELSISATQVGRLVAEGRLDRDTARTKLLTAANVLVETRDCHCTLDSVTAVIDDCFERVR